MLRRRATWFPGASLPPCQGQSSGSASLWSNRRHSSVSHSGPKSGNSYCRKVDIYKTWLSPLPHVPCWVPGRSSSGDPTLLRSSHCGRAGTRNHTCNNCNMHNWKPKRTISILFWRIFCITRPWSNKNMSTTRSLWALRARLLVGGPSGLLDFVLRTLRALRPCDPRNSAVIG